MSDLLYLFQCPISKVLYFFHGRRSVRESIFNKDVEI
uniref:Uncharacterized protein n=1 Tax=Anguilla anguilla TaxID=7936 RepID=A0A0E9RN50_ANGAN